MKKITLLLLLLSFLISCTGELKKENEELRAQVSNLQTENKNLQDELTSFRMDPANLLAKAERFYSEKNMDALRGTVLNFDIYHPTSELKNQVVDMITKLENEKKKEIAEQERIKKLEEQKKLASVNKLKKRLDDVSGVTWYTNPYFTHYNNRNLTSLYIGQNGSSVWLRIKMSYQGEDWIFFENAYLSYEGKTKEIVFDEYENKETEVGNGGVWEWIDVTVSEYDIPFLKNLAKSTDSKMRLTGKYTKTRNLSSNERKAIEDVLLAYDVLKGR
ncbi:MAG: hypothetical protein PHR52_12865 [Fermentimonas sp.]|nr:hypothetical protein [Fermentimonas sp.]